MPASAASLAPLPLDTLATFAADTADQARALSKRWFRHPLSVESKADDSPVTIADRTVEQFIRACIEATFPDHGILGEEHGRDRLDADFVWVIDPIDGTRSYITGWPIYGMLLAVLHRGRPVFGQIDMPVLDERWTGRQGGPTLWNGTPVTTSGRKELAHASVYTTSPDAFDEAGWQAYDRVSRKARARRFGGDCYSYGLLAAGHIDLVIESDLQPYDYLSLVPIIEGAGGRITDWQGKDLGVGSDGLVIAAATPELHEEALALLGQG